MSRSDWLLYVDCEFKNIAVFDHFSSIHDILFPNMRKSIKTNMSPLEIEPISPVVFPSLSAAVVGVVVGLVMCVGVIADMAAVCVCVWVGGFLVGSVNGLHPSN